MNSAVIFQWSQLLKRPLIFALAFSLLFSFPYPLQLASATDVAPAQEEVDHALTVAKDYLDYSDQFESVLNGELGHGLKIDVFSLLRQKTNVKMIEKKTGAIPKLRLVPWWTAQVQLVNVANDQEAARLHLKDAADFNPAKYRDTSFVCSSKEACRFNLTDSKGELLSEFSIPVQAAAVFGSYLVFIEPDKFDRENNRQQLSYIDLSTFEPLIGNEPLPVFDFFIKTKEPITSLDLENKGIRLNQSHGVLTKDFLRESSKHIFQPAFYLSANLVNPATTKGAINLVETIGDYLDALSRHEKSQSSMNLDHAYTAVVDVSALHDQVRRSLEVAKTREQMRKKVEDRHATKRKHGRQIVGESAKLLKAAELSGEQAEFVERFNKTVTESAMLDTVLTSSAQQTKLTRKLTYSVKRLARHFLTPKPASSRVLKNALGGYIARARASKTGERARKVVEWMAGRPFATVGMIGSAILAVSYPETVGHSIAESVRLSVTGAYSLFAGTGQAVAEGSLPVLAVVNPLMSIPVLNEAYVEGGNLAKFAIAMSGLAVSTASVLGAYHVTQNVVRLYIDSRKPEYQGFVARQEAIVQDYQDALAEAEAQKRQIFQKKASQIPEEVRARARQAVSELKAKHKEQRERPSLLKTVIKPVTWSVKSTAKAIKKAVPKSLSKKLVATGEKRGERRRFLKALRQFIFSYASYNRTALDYTGIWNAYSGLRYSSFQFMRLKLGQVKVPVFVRPKPYALFLRTAYPRMFSTVVAARQGEHVLPTKLNGGTDNLSTVAGRFLSYHLFTKYSQGRKTVKRRESARKTFEDAVIDIEVQVSELALRQTLNMLTRHLVDKGGLGALYASGSAEAISSRSLSELNYPTRVFVQTYFNRVFEESMRSILKKILKKADASEVDTFIQADTQAGYRLKKHNQKLQVVAEELVETGELGADTLNELKEVYISVISGAEEKQANAPPMTVDSEEIRSVVAAVAAQDDHYDEASKASKGAFLSINKKIQDMNTSFLSYLDPTQNASMERYATVQRKRQDPHALARAIRQELTEMFVTLPIDIGMKLLFTAGITEGPLKPIQNDLYGPHSVLYLSRMSFYNNFVAGLASSALANSWLKLQEDAFHDDAGNFGKIPQGEDASLPFYRWWWKQFRNPNNTLGINYRRYMTIVWHNIPAALPNISFWQLMALGRIDLELLTAGYLVAFSPISAFQFKLEQSFELSAYYDAKGIPTDLLHTPEVQAYLQEMSQMRRVKFNLLRDLLYNPFGEMLANVTVTPTSGEGSRGLMRTLMPGGVLPTERILNSIHHLSEAVENVPGLNKAADGLYRICEDLLSDGNNELTELIRKPEGK